MGFRTKQIHAGVSPDPVTGAILTPIYQSTTFVQESVDEYMSKGYSYSRAGNPTVRAFEEKLTALEGGHDTTAYASGMAATVAVLLGLLEQGDHVVAADVVYGGTVLRAFAEVEDALASEALIEERRQARRRAVQHAQRARDLARERWQLGLADFLAVADGQRQAFLAESALIELERERIQNRIRLFLALGGGFAAGGVDEVLP